MQTLMSHYIKAMQNPNEIITKERDLGWCFSSYVIVHV